MVELFLTHTVPNRHPVDDLHDVREQLGILKRRERELREEVLDNPDDLEGDECAAQIREHSYETLDIEAVIAHFGRERLRPFLITKTYTTVRCRPIENFG